MKLEAPPQYFGKRQLRVRVWLTQMERYMKLMHYAPTDWLDVVAMGVEGTASSWVNVGSVGCSGRPQASVPHMGPIQGCDGVAVRASYRG